MNAPMDPREHRRQALEHVALDAIGALSSTDDGVWVRSHLEAGCDICAAAANRVETVFDELLLAAPAVEPPARLRHRLLAGLEARDQTEEAPQPEHRPDDSPTQIWNRWIASEPKFYTLPASEHGWQEIDVPGISVRQLHVDELRDQVTMLIRMAAGTSYPAHRHGGDEQCYVLAGDLRVEDEVLGAGDYQFAPEGSLHGVQRTDGGCTLLIVSSRNDQLLTPD